MKVELTNITRDPWFGDPCVDLMTFLLTYPRKIHAQLMTHRTFSRNAQSSRAMRVVDMVRDVEMNPARIEHVFAGKGMQPSDRDVPEDTREWVEEQWQKHLVATIEFVTKLSRVGYAKEEVNRFLEPFAHITTIVTCTREAFNHFCSLRKKEKGAQGAIDRLAAEMRRQVDAAEPTLAAIHIPFPSAMPEDGNITWKDIAAQLTAGARVSYAKDTRDFDVEANVDLANRLWMANPRHASPMEHVVVRRPVTMAPVRCNFGDTFLQMRHLPESWTLEKACTWVLDEAQALGQLMHQPLSKRCMLWYKDVHVVPHDEFWRVYLSETPRPLDVLFQRVGPSNDRTETQWWCAGEANAQGMYSRPWVKGAMPVYPEQTAAWMAHLLKDEEWNEALPWLVEMGRSVAVDMRTAPSAFELHAEVAAARRQDEAMARKMFRSDVTPRFRERIQQLVKNNAMYVFYR